MKSKISILLSAIILNTSLFAVPTSARGAQVVDNATRFKVCEKEIQKIVYRTKVNKYTGEVKRHAVFVGYTFFEHYSFHPLPKYGGNIPVTWLLMNERDGVYMQCITHKTTGKVICIEFPD